jgi:hypothetical protein
MSVEHRKQACRERSVESAGRPEQNQNICG